MGFPRSESPPKKKHRLPFSGWTKSETLGMVNFTPQPTGKSPFQMAELLMAAYKWGGWSDHHLRDPSWHHPPTLSPPNPHPQHSRPDLQWVQTTRQKLHFLQFSQTFDLTNRVVFVVFGGGKQIQEKPFDHLSLVDHLHPGKWRCWSPIHFRKKAWNLKIMPLKRKIIFQSSMFGFRVAFRECK